MNFIVLNKNEDRVKNLHPYSAIRKGKAGTTDSLEAKTLDKHLEKYDRILFKGKSGKWHEYIATDLEETHTDEGIEHDIYCDNSVIELSWGFVEDKRIDNLPLSVACERAFSETRWGYRLTSDPKGTVSFYRESPFSAIEKILKAYQMEIETEINVMADGSITRCLVFTPFAGRITGKRFSWTKDMTEISRKVEDSEVITALYGFGNSQETDKGGHSRKLDFSSINTGKMYVEDREALSHYGYIGKDGRLCHRFGSVDINTDDKGDLLSQTRKTLETLSKPKVTYTASVIDLSNYGYPFIDAMEGDKVIVHDNDLDISVEARIMEIEEDLLEEQETKITLGNFLDTTATEGARLSRTVQDIKAGLDDTKREVNFARASADGKNTVYTGIDTPIASKIGDLWYKTLPNGEVEMRAWDGDSWQLIVDTYSITEAKKAGEEVAKNVKETKAELDKETAYLKAKQAEVDKKIQSAKSDLDQAKKDIEQAKSDLEKAKSETNLALQNTENTLTEKLQILTSQVEGAKSEFRNSDTELISKIAGLTASDKETKKSLSTIAQKADGIQSLVVEISTALGDFETKENANRRFSSLEQTAKGLQSTVVSMDTRLMNKVGVEAYNKNYAKINQKADGIASTVQSLTKTVDGKADKTAVSKVSQKADGIESSVASLSKTLDGKADKTAISRIEQTAIKITQTISETQSKVAGFRVNTRNLLLESDRKIVNSGTYRVARWELAEELTAGETVTLTVCARPLKEGRWLRPFHGGGWIGFPALESRGETGGGYTLYSSTFAWADKRTEGDTTYTPQERYVWLYHGPNGEEGVLPPCYIKWAVLTRGTVPAVDWSKPPEETDKDIENTNTRIDTAEKSIQSLGTKTDGKITATNTRIDTANKTIQSLESSLNGKITQSNTRISTAESNISSIKNTLNSKADSSQITQLSNLIKTKVSSGDLISTINQEAGRVLITVGDADGKNRIRITRENTYLDSAIIDTAEIEDGAITNSKIRNLSADKITTGTLNASNVNIINMNANAITTGTLSGTKGYWNLNTGRFFSGSWRSNAVTIEDGEMTSYWNGSKKCLIDGDGMKFFHQDNSGVEVGHIGTSKWKSSGYHNLRFAHEKNTSMTISYKNGNGYTSYVVFDKYNTADSLYGNDNTRYPIKFAEKTSFMQAVRISDFSPLYTGDHCGIKRMNFTWNDGSTVEGIFFGNIDLGIGFVVTESARFLYQTKNGYTDLTQKLIF